ncbi:MAG: hypothetical protein AMJ53_11740 [Gammaproteobacteria bacterium SG8_11]|nr:MAG: hypothetical protein AMJ53_11740 [Gammaproteobacteria bacterium SG8_11]
MNETQFFVLPDKRKLCYAEYGISGGCPILYCHGFPSSRLEAALAQPAAQRLGIRMISIDRPGFGQSDYLLSRSILDWPEDVKALMSHLGIDKFSVVGISGGAPYAMSCAARLPEFVSKLGIVCGLGWLGDQLNLKRMRKPFQLLIKLYASYPSVSYWATQRVLVPLLSRSPAFVFHMIKKLASQDDKELLNDPKVGIVIEKSLEEAFAQGSKGPIWELALHNKPWGFDLRSINAETYLWHGDNDNTVPLAMGQYHAKMLPHAKLKIFPGEGHFTVPIRHLGEILQTLCVQTK